MRIHISVPQVSPHPTPAPARRRRGFTLIEATFALILITILSALAVAGGMILLSGSKDGSAKHNLQVAAAAAESYYNEWASFPSATQMASAESAFSYVDGSTSAGLSTSSTVISVYATTGASPTYTMAVLSDSGSCFLDTVAPLNSSTADVHKTTTAANCYASTSAGTGSW